MPSRTSSSSSFLPFSLSSSPDKKADTDTNASPLNINGISGNVSPTIKGAFLKPGMIFPTLDHDGKYRVLGFAMETVFQRVAVTEIISHHYESEYEFDSDKETQNSIEGNVDSRVDSVTLVCEVDVLPDMANNHHHLHGGCAAFLIDMCSSLSLVALTMIVTDGNSRRPMHHSLTAIGTVSQSLNVVYHSPSPVGDRLRIVNTTMPLPSISDAGEDAGSNNVCIRTEIWSIHHHRLVASGIHNKMSMASPSQKTEPVSRKSRL